MQPPAAPNVVVLLTNDGTARVSGRNPINYATFSMAAGHSANLLRWTKAGEPDIDQVISVVLYQSATNTYFILTALKESDKWTYGWVREKQENSATIYDLAQGSFWDFAGSGVTTQPIPVPTELVIEQDLIWLHTTTAFDDYISGMGGAPTVQVNALYLGNCPAQFMTRYEVDTPEFDYVQHEPDAIFYKVVGNHKEWHVFLRALCVKANQPNVTRFLWQVVNADGDFYSSSGLLRLATHPEYIQQALS